MLLNHLRNLADRMLRLPELKGMQGQDFDSRAAAILQQSIFQRKRILNILYEEYSRSFVESVIRAPHGARMLEVGSGISPLRKRIPRLITSDIVSLPWLNLVCSAYALPFRDASLDRVFIMFAFHHLGDVEAFLSETYRCLKPGGELVLIDPAMTPFSRLYYKYCHVDSMDIDTQDWRFGQNRRMSDSNIALAWIVFFRDSERFRSLFPGFVIQDIRYSTCISFLLSGGLRIRQLLPTIVLKLMFRMENWIIRHVTNKVAVIMSITIKKTG